MKTGGGGFTLGYGNMNHSAFSDFMPKKYAGPGNHQFSLGITGNRIYTSGWMTGLSAGFNIGKKVRTDSINYSFSGFGGSFDIGYMIYDNKKVKLFPTLGAGGLIYGMKMKRNALNPDAITTVNYRPISIQHAGIVFDLAMNIRWTPNMHFRPEKGSSSSWMTGLKIGYKYGLKNNTWRYTGGSITEGPNFGAGMFYAQLVIGGFGSKPL